MSTIVTRSGKGSPLTNAEMDANLINLNNDKLEDITNESIGDLSDVSSTSPSSGDALVWNGTTWAPSAPFSQSDFDTAFAAKDITDLSNVNVTSPSDGQVLSYDSTSSTWISTTPSTGTSTGSVIVNDCTTTNIDSFSASAVRSAIYNIVISTAMGFQSSEVRIVHNGSTAFLLESNKQTTGFTICTYSAELSSGTVYLKVNPDFGPSVIDFSKTEIAVSSAALSTIVPLPTDLATGSGTIDLDNGCGTIDLAA